MLRRTYLAYLGEKLDKYHGATLGVFQVKQGEVIVRRRVIRQKGPVKGKFLAWAQSYARFQDRANGAGLPSWHCETREVETPL